MKVELTGQNALMNPFKAAEHSFRSPKELWERYKEDLEDEKKWKELSRPLPQ